LTPPEQNLIQYLSAGYSDWTGYPYGQGSIGMYPINGCTKDYDYGCGGEIAWSVEVCYIKTPHPDSIDVVFERDRPAMLGLMDEAEKGIHGQVTDSLTGEPLYALIYVGPSDWLSYSCPVNGDFHRFYLPGTYDVTVFCPGYEPKTMWDVVVPADVPDSSVYLDIQLMPNADLPVYATRMIGSRYVNSSSNLTYPVWALGPHDSQAYRLDGTKWIVLAFDFPIRNGPGNDLSIYRSSGSGSATVKVGNDWRGNWQTIGTANSAIHEFDIGTVGLDSVCYVRLEASSQFMLDAVEAVQFAPGIAQGGSQQIAEYLKIAIRPTILSKSTMLTIDNPHDKPVFIQVFNTLGQKVDERRLYPGSSRVEVSHYPQGVYYITTPGSTITHRFVLLK
jgi:hypothetical protein